LPQSAQVHTPHLVLEDLLTDISIDFTHRIFLSPAAFILFLSTLLFLKEKQEKSASEWTLFEQGILIFLMRFLNIPEAKKEVHECSQWERLQASARNASSQNLPWMKAFRSHSTKNLPSSHPIPPGIWDKLDVPICQEFARKLPIILIAFHLIHEDLKLSLLRKNERSNLAALLLSLSDILGAYSYCDYFHMEGATPSCVLSFKNLSLSDGNFDSSLFL